MQFRECASCGEYTPENAFRKGRADCVWCQYSDMEKRAKARYLDKQKSAEQRLHIEKADFVSWYTVQSDECAYCSRKLNLTSTVKIRSNRHTADVTSELTERPLLAEKPTTPAMVMSVLITTSPSH